MITLLSRIVWVRCLRLVFGRTSICCYGQLKEEWSIQGWLSLNTITRIKKITLECLGKVRDQGVSMRALKVSLIPSDLKASQLEIRCIARIRFVEFQCKFNSQLFQIPYINVRTFIGREWAPEN